MRGRSSPADSAAAYVATSSRPPPGSRTSRSRRRGRASCRSAATEPRTRTRRDLRPVEVDPHRGAVVGRHEVLPLAGLQPGGVTSSTVDRPARPQPEDRAPVAEAEQVLAVLAQHGLARPDRVGFTHASSVSRLVGLREAATGPARDRSPVQATAVSAGDRAGSAEAVASRVRPALAPALSHAALPRRLGEPVVARHARRREDGVAVRRRRLRAARRGGSRGANASATTRLTPAGTGNDALSTSLDSDPPKSSSGRGTASRARRRSRTTCADNARSDHSPWTWPPAPYGSRFPG